MESAMKESAMKAGMDGTSGSRAISGPAPQFSHYLLRVAAFVATMVAAIVMAVAKQTEIISVVIAPTLPPLPIPVTAKTTYSSAYVFFFVTNAIVCAYSVLSLAISFANKGRRQGLALLITIMDIVVLSLLFSALGAAGAIGVVGERGITRVGWNKVCNVYGEFCSHIIASIVISFSGTIFYLSLVLSTVISLHRTLQ